MQDNLFKKVEEERFIRAKAIAIGLVTGIINGLFGGGGGMIIVPFLEKVFKLETKKSHATAILIILPITVVSGLFYIIFKNAKADIVLSTTFGVIVGGLIGAVLLKKLASKTLSIIFVALMMIAGIKLLLF